MIHSCQQLHVNAQPAVHIAARFSDKAHRELSLEHEHCTSKHWSVLKELENKRRRYLIGSVGNAQVKERKLGFDCVALDQLELVLVTELVHSLGHLCYHARVDLHCNSLFAPL